MTSIKWKLLGIPLLLILIQFVGPTRSNPPEVAGRAIESRLSLPPEVNRTLVRACVNCHSHRTVWPWYSRVAPASWFVIDHVNFGRRSLNFSDWARYDAEEQEELLEEMCELITQGEMPLAPYVWMHDEARLRPQEIEQVCRWSRLERTRLGGRNGADVRD
ncbi:MAG: heme-binding domain-containing protein [Acidobacteriota bacterium]